MKPEETPDPTIPEEQLPDPSGPPQPPNEMALAGRFLLNVAVGVSVVGGLLCLFTVNMCTTAGATRSAKLKFSDRAKQIEQAMEQEEAYRQREQARDTTEQAPLR